MSTPLSSRGCHTPPQPRGQLVGSGKNSSPANFPSTWLPSSREPREEKHGRAVFVFKEGFKAILVDTLSLAAVIGSRAFGAFDRFHADTRKIPPSDFIRYFRGYSVPLSPAFANFFVTATLERSFAKWRFEKKLLETPSTSTVDSFVDIFCELFHSSNRNSK